MLTYLHIENFALIDRLELEFGPGLTVLSGETGAGKSIILAAMGLILGQRAAADLIRQGADQAVVEAIFQVDENGPIADILADELDNGLEPGGELIIRRVVNREGRNRVQICGALSPLALLGRLGPELVSVVGQHDSASLLKPDQHLALLDAFGGLEKQHAEVAEAVKAVKIIDRQIRHLKDELEARRRRKDDLDHTVKELEAAALNPAEEDDLRAERDLLANSELVGRLSREAHNGLYAADGSILEYMGKVKALLEDLAAVDERAKGMSGRGEELYYLLEDLAADVRTYNERLNFDPGRLDWLEGRLHQIQRITRKYGGDSHGALETLAEAKQELESLETGDQQLADMAKQRQVALNQAVELAERLSTARRKAAARLSGAVIGELAELGMDQCRFEADFPAPAGGALDTPQGPLSSQGLETCEFLIAPNPGEGLRRLARIASGGELSRLLLALRGVVARRMGMPTMVFDEVDAGVGGATGAAIGRKLAALSSGAQVICITHLPQIAAWADRHIAVQKQVSGGRTATALSPLDDQGRLDELARMLAGPDGQASAMEHAASLLHASAREKAQGLGSHIAGTQCLGSHIAGSTQSPE